VATLVLAVGAALLVIIGLRHGSSASGGARPVVLCSKDFTEQVILGEIVAQELEARGVPVTRQFELGGNLCHDALLAGRVDGYPEYTGTAFTALLHHPPSGDVEAVRAEVRREYAERFSVEVGAGLGFRNDFAILVRGDDARRLGLRTISDAAPRAPGWIAAFGQDFMSRPDGWAGFSRAYGLRFKEPPREMDLSLTYRALAAHEVDLIAGNGTDGLIAKLDLFALDDDKRYFPPYEAVLLFRRDAIDRAPALRAVVAALAGAISTGEMRRMNLAVDGEQRAPAEVARAFRRQHLTRN
jgi:glycine betaine/choline ABC-type transport system substrate-binding protein